MMQLRDVENASDQDVFWIGLREFSGETVSVNGDETVFTKFSEVSLSFGHVQPVNFLLSLITGHTIEVHTTRLSDNDNDV